MENLNIPQQNFSGIVGGGELSLYQYFIASPLFAEFTDFNSTDRKLFLADYSKMSPNLKNFFASTETATLVSGIGLTYQLDDNQVSAVAGAIRDVMTGKIFIKDFPITISSKLGIDDLKAGEIANKIISKSFGPILEDVKRIQRSKFPDKISQIQKESQPAGLTQPTARSLPAVPPRPEIKSPQPPPQQTSSFVPSQPQAVRPPQQMPPPTPNLPNDVRQAPPQSPPQSPPTPSETPKPRPKLEFKVPDLSGIRIPPPTPSSQAGESLEKELEKVASIIDLRNKPKE